MEQPPATPADAAHDVLVPPAEKGGWRWWRPPPLVIVLAATVAAILIPFAEPSQYLLRILEQVAASTNNPELQETMQRAIEQAASQTGAQRLISALPISIVGAAILVGFTVLGGVLGVKFFEKRSGQMPPPGPPPSYPPPPPPGSGWPQGGA